MKIQIVRGTTQIEGLNQASNKATGNGASGNAGSASANNVLRSDAVVSFVKTAGRPSGIEKPLNAKEADSFAKNLADKIREESDSAEQAHTMSSGGVLRESA